MLKNVILIGMMLLSSVIQAKESIPLYQIDLIVFAYQQTSFSPGLSMHSTLSVSPSKTILLQTEVSKTLSPFHLLPSSASQLREEFWALHRKPQYRVLLNYTWLQPLNSQNTITIPKLYREGWEIEGTFRIQHSNYYSFDSELLISAPGSKQNPFVLSQNQRLKGGEIYYLDHPQAGMLIKIHPLT